MSKGLKALKKIEKEMSRLCGYDIAYDGKVFDLFSIVGKELQAFEIIKERQVNVGALLELDNLEEYNNYCDVVGGCKKLTIEEYDLVKEVLDL